MDNRFCQKCGAPLQPGDQFCEKCGSAVSADAGQEPLVHGTPQKGETGSVQRKSAWPTLLAVLTLLLAAGAVWYYVYPMMRTGRGGAEQAGTATGPGAWQVTRKLADYAGTWEFTGDNSSSPIVITLREDHGRITGAGMESHGTAIMIELTDFMGGKLSGTATTADKSSPVTADLTSDGNRLILTAEDPPGKYQTITGTRQGASPAVRSVPRAPKLGPNANSPNVSSRTEAISIVMELPEVREWASRIGQSSARFDVTSETRDHYTARASEAPSGGGPRGATFGTCNVDRKTGKVYSPPF